MKRTWQQQKQRRKGSRRTVASPVEHDWSPLLQWLAEPDGIRLGDQIGWEVSCPGDAALFVMALSEILPGDAIIVLESTPALMPNDVVAFLESRPAENVQNVSSGTISSWDRFFHLPATRENLAELGDFFDRYAAPQICDHFHAYAPKGMLLEWFDSFSDPVHLSRTIPELRVRSFCQLVGCSCAPYSYETG